MCIGGHGQWGWFDRGRYRQAGIQRRLGNPRCSFEVGRLGGLFHYCPARQHAGAGIAHPRPLPGVDRLQPPRGQIERGAVSPTEERSSEPPQASPALRPSITFQPTDAAPSPTVKRTAPAAAATSAARTRTPTSAVSSAEETTKVRNPKAASPTPTGFAANIEALADAALCMARIHDSATPGCGICVSAGRRSAPATMEPPVATDRDVLGRHSVGRHRPLWGAAPLAARSAHWGDGCRPDRCRACHTTASRRAAINVMINSRGA